MKSCALLTPSLLLCPLCHQPLQPADAQPALRCPSNHHFDIARQGYVNLLPVQFKRSKAPGDTVDMVNARTTFLDSGHYDPLLAALITAVEKNLTGASDSPVILDAGCGEGFYTQSVHQHLTTQSEIKNLQCYGLDISREAVRKAATRDKTIHWLVGSSRDIPLPDSSIGIILSIFSPVSAEHFRQRMTADGKLIVLTAGANHLMELKERIYEDIRPYNDNKLPEELAGQFTLAERQRLRHTITLSSQAEIHALLAMTPHTWRASAEKRKALEALETLTLTVDVQLMVFEITDELIHDTATR